MNSTQPQITSAGLAVLCDRQGVITKLVSDGVGLCDWLKPGNSLIELVHEESRAKASEFLAALRENQIAFDWELTVRLENGELRSLHFTGAGVDEPFVVVIAGSRAAMASMLENLTLNISFEPGTKATLQALSVQARAHVDTDAEYYDELTRLNNELASAQRELAKQNAELARLNDQKNQFLGIAAHDLRNPLDVILTYSMFISNEARDVLTPNQLDFIEKIRTSSEFMLRLVNNLLDVSRIESGRLDLDLDTVNLADVLRDNLARNQVLAAKKQITLKLIESDEISPVRIDISKIEQVLNNLLGNAVKFSPGGSLVEVLLEKRGSEVVVSVKDQGEGLTGDDLERLFRPFVRGKSGSTYKEKGTGLGLAICKRIVEGHGGRIWAENLASGGAIFTFTLPANDTG